jgi:hypothetical protein
LGLPDFESDGARIREAAMARIGLVRRYQLGRHADEAIRLISELSIAFDCLSTPQRKQHYDEGLRAAVAPSLASTIDETAAGPTIQIHASQPRTERLHGSRKRQGLARWLLGAVSVAVVILVSLFAWRESAPKRPGVKETTKPAKARQPQPNRATPEPASRYALQPPRSDGPLPAAPLERTWQIVNARYGARQKWTDTTAIVRQFIRNERIDFQVSNRSMRGDPAYGQIKSLVIELKRGDQHRTLRFGEGQRVVLNLNQADPSPSKP